MAKDIQLGRKPQREQPPPADLVARVTGKQPANLPPPPQKQGQALPPGVTGDLPLPTGKVVKVVNPSSMTPQERAALDAVGWTEAKEIPEGLIDEATARKVAEADEVVLPIDPRTPPAKMDTKPISQVTAEERGQALAALQQSQALLMAQQTVPGMTEALAAVAQSQQFTAQKRAAEVQLEVEDDRDKVKKNNPEPASEPEVAKSTFEESLPPGGETGADAMPAVCRHCGHDLTDTNVPEPSYQEKMVFLHAMLGEKTFVKEYELFGGNIAATFRTLTTREIDVVYKQAWRDRERGVVVTDIDYWERINRYRLFLQLLCLKSTATGGFIHDMPDGLSKETNPGCEATWNLGEMTVDPNETPLPMIEEWIIENVLKTEAIYRVVNTTCNEFNRLVARLEAMADNSDFWRRTEEQS